MELSVTAVAKARMKAELTSPVWFLCRKQELKQAYIFNLNNCNTLIQLQTSSVT